VPPVVHSLHERLRVLRAHRGRRVAVVSGRDPHEAGRTATSLELLFDLVFVVAISQAADQLARLLAQGHVLAATGGFAFAMYAVLWPWINFSWFSSAFDTDDGVHRIATMVQMVGATVLGLGIPAAFRSIDAGQGIDNGVMVAGYVVVRVALVFQWLRAAMQSPRYRSTCLTYSGVIVIAQIGWIATALVPLTVTQAAVAGAALLALELGGPYMAERRHAGTPWHAHHIAERYGGLAIIALGEGVVGTVASLSAVVRDRGWTIDAVLVAVAGMGLTFGMWWAYFLVSTAELLHAHRERAFKWSYGSLPVFVAIAATGAGLHVAALVIGHQAHIASAAAVLALAVPVAAYLAGLHWLHGVLHARAHRHVAPLLFITAAVLIAAPLLASIGVSMTVCLLVVMVAPAINVVAY
jgi:low temperature requirement protein LtrA